MKAAWVLVCETMYACLIEGNRKGWLLCSRIFRKMVV